MKRCTSCNRQCEDFVRVCPNCGKPFSQGDIFRNGGANGPGVQGPGYGMQQNQNYAQPGFARSPYDHTMEFSPEEISKGKPFAMVAYLLGVVGIFFCLMMRNSSYVKFHVRENCKYVVLKIICGAIFGFLGLLFYALAGATRTFVVYDGYYGARLGGLAITGNVFFGIGTLLILAVVVLQIISFILVCTGRSTEGLLVRHFKFMK